MLRKKTTSGIAILTSLLLFTSCSSGKAKKKNKETELTMETSKTYMTDETDKTDIKKKTTDKKKKASESSTGTPVRSSVSSAVTGPSSQTQKTAGAGNNN